MSAAPIEHLKQQDDAVAAYTSSMLSFASLVFNSRYSAMKAACTPTRRYSASF
jgi:short-subunit dehydrogenase involved in D-alanine esterification of teichoic acids